MKTIDIQFCCKDIAEGNLTADMKEHQSRVEEAYDTLIRRSGKGNDYLGWLDLPQRITPDLIDRIREKADELYSFSEIVVVIGIGGSYLGARAVIEMLNPYFHVTNSIDRTVPDIVYAGNQLSEDYMHDLLHVLDQKEYSLIVISKSGTTTEPALAFRILKDHCENKYGREESARRIVAITDAKKGALKQIAEENNYCTFDIPDDVGGRYSVLTPVGLLPIAVAGFDIEKIMEGAGKMQSYLMENRDLSSNIAMQYALLRYLLYRQNKKIELMVAYEPKLFYFIEWFKQLFGESEGKEHKGLFPAGAVFSTDLHSLGQYIQEGERDLFETVISVENSFHAVGIPEDEANTDQLNYLTDKTMQSINLIAEEGTRRAHLSGGVPNLRISIPAISEPLIGELIYFFEFSCALSGYMLGINPFDQPGVEAYKKNMFRLLGKPGI